jgi:hypothetical protein
MGIGVGYPDPDSAVNLASSSRVPVHEVARLY